MEKALKNSGFLLFLVLVFIGLAVLYRGGSPEPEKFSLNRLVDQINQENVKSITVDTNDLSIVLNDDKIHW